MSLTKFTENLNNIQSLPDKPSMTADELKAEFDKAGNAIKKYINETLTEEVDGIDNKKVDKIPGKTLSSNDYTDDEKKELARFSNGDIYSTEEVKTNKVWIDGKPIYRKVLELTSVIQPNTTTFVNTNTTNIETMLKYDGLGYTNSSVFTLNRAHSNSFQYQMSLFYSKTNNRFEIESGSSMSVSKCYIIFEYTKTTD